MRNESRVLLVDDHPIVRQGIAQVLIDTIPGVLICEAVDGPSAAAALRDQRVDLIILDLTLPGETGLVLLRRFRREFERVPVLILSMHPAEDFAARAIQSGAVGYVTKDTAPADLAAAVTAALDGRPLPERAAGASRQEPRQPHDSLSDREYQVLRLMGAGRTVSQIGSELGLSVKTVSTYRTRILEKLDLRTSAELIHYAVVNGVVP